MYVGICICFSFFLIGLFDASVDFLLFSCATECTMHVMFTYITYVHFQELMSRPKGVTYVNITCIVHYVAQENRRKSTLTYNSPIRKKKKKMHIPTYMQEPHWVSS